MSGKGTPMTTSDAARIQSAGAKAGDGGVDKGSFAARAQVPNLSLIYSEQMDSDHEFPQLFSVCMRTAINDK